MSPARTRRPHRRPGPPTDPPTDPPSGPAPAAAPTPAGSLDSFCPLIDLASIISDSRRDKAARHAEKPTQQGKLKTYPVAMSGVLDSRRRVMGRSERQDHRALIGKSGS